MRHKEAAADRSMFDSDYICVCVHFCGIVWLSPKLCVSTQTHVFKHRYWSAFFLPLELIEFLCN